jgi:hypothetical protein
MGSCCSKTGKDERTQKLDAYLDMEDAVSVSSTASSNHLSHTHALTPTSHRTQHLKSFFWVSWSQSTAPHHSTARRFKKKKIPEKFKKFKNQPRTAH